MTFLGKNMSGHPLSRSPFPYIEKRSLTRFRQLIEHRLSPNSSMR